METDDDDDDDDVGCSELENHSAVILTWTWPSCVMGHTISLCPLFLTFIQHTDVFQQGALNYWRVLVCLWVFLCECARKSYMFDSLLRTRNTVAEIHGSMRGDTRNVPVSHPPRCELGSL